MQKSLQDEYDSAPKITDRHGKILIQNNLQDQINFISKRHTNEGLKIGEEKNEVDFMNENLSNVFLRVCHFTSEWECNHLLN